MPYNCIFSVNPTPITLKVAERLYVLLEFLFIKSAILPDFLRRAGNVLDTNSLAFVSFDFQHDCLLINAQQAEMLLPVGHVS